MLLQSKITPWMCGFTDIKPPNSLLLIYSFRLSLLSARAFPPREEKDTVLAWGSHDVITAANRDNTSSRSQSQQEAVGGAVSALAREIRITSWRGDNLTNTEGGKWKTLESKQTQWMTKKKTNSSECKTILMNGGSLHMVGLQSSAKQWTKQIIIWEEIIL